MNCMSFICFCPLRFVFHKTSEGALLYLAPVHYQHIFQCVGPKHSTNAQLALRSKGFRDLGITMFLIPFPKKCVQCGRVYYTTERSLSLLTPVLPRSNPQALLLWRCSNPDIWPFLSKMPAVY